MSGESTVELLSSAKNEGKYVTATASGLPYEGVGRWVVENGVRRWHTGAGLVTSNETILRNKAGEVVSQYNLQTDPGVYLAGLSPSQRVLQMQLLANAGLIDPGSIGNYNAELAALTNAMELGNFSGLEWSNAINKRLAQGPVRGGGGGPVRTYKKTSAEDLRTIANKVAQTTLGRELTTDEIAKFTESYNQQEVAYQKSLYAGGTVTEAPSIDVAAESFAKQAAPKEAGAYQYLNYMNKLFSMIGVS